MNPAIQQALDRNDRVFPVLRVDWTSRGHSLAIDYAAPGGIILPGVPLRAKAAAGGWQPIQYGPGVRGSTLASTRTSVRLEDIDRGLIELLETYNPRGSVAKISWAALGVAEADWEPVFVGIVEDWRTQAAGAVDVILKTDETELRSPAPKPQFQRATWPTAADPSLYGTTIPLVFGAHDSFRITVRGMTRALNVRRDEASPTTLQLYSASLGNLADIARVYYDGALQDGLNFQVLRGLYGGVFQTVLGIERDDAPAGEVMVSIDCLGPDTTGGTNPATTMVNPASQLRVFLEEYTFRDNQTGVYVGAHPRIEQTSWAAVEAFFAARDYDSGIIIGGSGGSRPLGLDIVESFLQAYQFVRLWWNEQGQIEAHVVDYEDTDPDPAAWYEADKHTVPGSFKYEPGDRKDVFNRVEMPYLFSDVDGKFLATHEAHDVPSIEKPLGRPLPNLWSPARYDRETI